MSKTYIVDGMTCGGCSKSVIKAIEGLGEGINASVDLATKKVTVAGEASEEAIKEAVEEAGFDFLGAA